jgi:hypothetical protein
MNIIDLCKILNARKFDFGEILRENKGFVRRFAAFGLRPTPKVNFLTTVSSPITSKV